MKRAIVLLLPALLLCGAQIAPAEEGINPIGEAFVAAVNAGDADAVAALYLPDAVSYAPDAMVHRGREAIRASWEELFGQFDCELSSVEGQYEIVGDLATAWGLFRMVMVPKGGGEETVMEGRYMDVARLVDGHWMYVADHVSVPMPPPAEHSAGH